MEPRAIVGATAVWDRTEMADRQKQTVLFTAATRRDIYAVLLNPADPHVIPSNPSAAATAATAKGQVPYEVALVARASSHSSSQQVPVDPSSPSSGLDTFAFVDRSASQLPDGWLALEDDLLLAAVRHMGEASPLSLGATKAFEAFLAEKARAWGPQQVARLSIDFVVAFGNELTPRLDIHHRIASNRLSGGTLARLSSAPYCNFIDQGFLHSFQDVPPSPESSLSPRPQPVPLAAVALAVGACAGETQAPAKAPQGSADTPTPLLMAPESPRLTPLPPLPSLTTTVKHSNAAAA